MYKSRSGRVVFALIVMVALSIIGRNLYRRYLNNALVAAIQADDVSAVRSLLQRGADPCYRYTAPPNERGSVPPQTALDMTLARIESGSEVTSGLNGEQQTLHVSVNASAETIACLLIRNGADLEGVNALYTACYWGNIALARAILDRGFDFKSSNDGQFILGAIIHYANPYSNSSPSRALTPSQQADVAQRRIVSRQLVQLLGVHGVHLTLTEALQIGDTAAISEILRGNRAVWASEGYSALCTAAGKGDLDLARQLLDDGVDPNMGNSYWAPLSEAAGAGNFAMVKLLLARGAKVNAVKSNSPLLSAIQNSRADLVRYLLAHGADPNVDPGSDLSALARALRTAPAVAPDLLKHGAQVNPVLQPGLGGEPPFSPLINAAWYAPQYESRLYRAGARIGADRTGICALAARRGRADLLSKLLAYGAEVNGKDSNRDTPLAMCIEHAPSSVGLLLAHGADPNMVSHSLQTPLEEAAMIGNADVVRLLLAHGANLNARTDRHTALDWAKKKKHADVIDLLQQAGAKE